MITVAPSERDLDEAETPSELAGLFGHPRPAPGGRLDPPADDTDTSADGRSSEPGRGRSDNPDDAAPTVRRRRWPTVACAAVAVAGLAGTAVFGRAWLDQRSSAGAASAVRATSTGFVTALTNFDPGTVNSDFSRIQAYAAGGFAGQAKQFFGSSIRQQLTAAGAASRGKVQDLFVESLGSGQATVFAVVGQTYVNGKMSNPTTDTLRLELGLTDTANGWRISSVTVLESPSGFTSGAPPTSSKSH